MENIKQKINEINKLLSEVVENIALWQEYDTLNKCREVINVLKEEVKYARNSNFEYAKKVMNLEKENNMFLDLLKLRAEDIVELKSQLKTKQGGDYEIDSI